MIDVTTLPDAHLRVFDRPPVPEPDQIANVYLIGICGKGMGSLAGLFQEAGYQVRGADEAAYPPMSTRLEAMGVEVLEGYDPAHLDPHPDLVIVGNASTPTHPEATFAREQDLAQQSFPEALAHFFIRDRRSLVVAGTHGKTTTTGMLAHLFRSAGRDPGFLVGGIMVNGGLNYAVGSGEHFIVEGDEYDSAYWDKSPKFWHYRPTVGIVTSMEFDHADIYADWDAYRAAFREFARRVSPGGQLVLYGDDPEVRALAAYATHTRLRFYGLNDRDDDITARDVQTDKHGQRFILVINDKEICQIYLRMTGEHNLLNALAVSQVALNQGLTPLDLQKGFHSFRGMQRRQEILGAPSGVLVMDDFAHHPTAVRATIRAVKDRFPEHRLVAIFEPRSNSSRRKVFQESYALAFSEADFAFLSAPPLRHNDVATDFLDIDELTADISASGTPAVSRFNADALLSDILAVIEPGDVALVMSNGSFDNLQQKLVDALRRSGEAPKPVFVESEFV